MRSHVLGPEPERGLDVDPTEASILELTPGRNRVGSAELVHGLPWVTDERDRDARVCSETDHAEVDLVAVEDLVHDDRSSRATEFVAERGAESSILEGDAQDLPSFEVTAPSCLEVLSEVPDRADPG